MGEATHNGREESVNEELFHLNRTISGLGSEDARQVLAADPAAKATFARRIAVSALDQALWDIQGQKQNAPIRSLLTNGTKPLPERLSAYANLNRALSGAREPTDFARMARAAVSDGFKAVKCAPFDAVEPETPQVTDAGLYKDGLARIRAVREAIGPGTDLAVDCHWRFELSVADRVLRDIAELGVSTVEAVVPDRDLLFLARTGRSLSRAGVRLVAGELATRVDHILSLIEAGSVDVVSPDVKYIGGITALVEVARACGAASIGFSPHNPSGPVASLASAQVLSTMQEGPERLEFPYGECPWRSSLLSGDERLIDGELALPNKPGLGARLDDRTVKANPPATVRRTVAPSLEERGLLA